QAKWFPNSFTLRDFDASDAADHKAQRINKNDSLTLSIPSFTSNHKTMKQFFILLLFICPICDVAQTSGKSKLKKEQSKSPLAGYEKYIDEHRDAHLNELAELISFPSISSMPSHKPDMERAAAWIVNKLKAIGISNAQLLPTEGAPVVYGSWEKAPGKTTV